MVGFLEKAIELLGWAFFAFYFYQMAYIAVSLLRKPRVHKAKVQHHFGVLISARNEELVIGQLIRSIRQQNYPQELLDPLTGGYAKQTSELLRKINSAFLIPAGQSPSVSFYFNQICYSIQEKLHEI